MPNKYRAKALDDALDYLTIRRRFKADAPLTVAEAQRFFQCEFDLAEKTVRDVLATWSDPDAPTWAEIDCPRLCPQIQRGRA